MGRTRVSTEGIRRVSITDRSARMSCIQKYMRPDMACQHRKNQSLKRIFTTPGSKHALYNLGATFHPLGMIGAFAIGIGDGRQCSLR